MRWFFDPVKIVWLRRPAMVFVVCKGTGVDGMLVFKFVLPAPGASDVTERRLNFTIGDAEPISVTLEGGALESGEYQGQQGVSVNGSLVDVDDAANASDPRDFAIVLADTIAPPQPGEVGVTVTSET